MALHDAATLFRDHAPFVANALRRLGVAPGDVDDLVQQVFLTVHKKEGFTEEAAHPRTWLYNIARRHASNWRRIATRRVEPIGDLIPDPRAGPFERVAEMEAWDRLERVLEGLEDTLRVVFELFEIEGQPGPWIATELGIPVGTVYSRLHEARKQVEAAYERLPRSVQRKASS